MTKVVSLFCHFRMWLEVFRYNTCPTMANIIVLKGKQFFFFFLKFQDSTSGIRISTLYLTMYTLLGMKNCIWKVSYVDWFTLNTSPIIFWGKSYSDFISEKNVTPIPFLKFSIGQKFYDFCSMLSFFFRLI